MMKRSTRLLSTIAVVMMVILIASGCSTGSAPAASAPAGTTAAPVATVAVQPQPLLEYTYVTEIDPSKFADNPNDVVTPYIEKKFNIKVKEIVYYNATVEPFKEMMNQWIAAGNLPDVFLTSSVEYSATAGLGVYADLGKYVNPQYMPNFCSYFDMKFLNEFKNNGVLYQIPCVEVNTATDPRYATDPYVEGTGAHAFWVREDVLAKAGYKFTPIDEIAKETTDAGKKPTLDQLKIDPPINTPDDFYQLLAKIKSLNLTVNGKPMIPFDMYGWWQFHMGSMFGAGQFSVDKTGNVSGYLGAPDAKAYYQYLNKLYNEQLIDQDFLIQKGDQMDEKIASGQVAAGGYFDNMTTVVQSLEKNDPAARIRFIPWPKEDPNYGFYDIFKGGFRSVTINKDFKEIERLVKYFDWFYSDEGLDVITWGPESAGLWQMQDGKKVFKDKTVENDILNGIKGDKGADYYGLYDWTLSPAFNSKAVNGVPFLAFPNPKSYQRSYPLKLDIEAVTRDMFSQAGVNTQGTASYPVGDAASATDTYYWGDFYNDGASLLTAKTGDDFNAAWDKIYQTFLDKGQYQQAVADMTKILKP